MKSNKCDVCFSHKETFRIKYIWTRRSQPLGKPFFNWNVNVTDCIDPTRTCRVNWEIGMYQTLISSSVLPRLTSNFESISPTTYNCRTKCNKNWYGRVYLKQTLCVNPTSTCWKITHRCQLYSSKNQIFKKFNRSWIIRGHWTWRRSH